MHEALVPIQVAKGSLLSLLPVVGAHAAERDVAGLIDACHVGIQSLTGNIPHGKDGL